VAPRTRSRLEPIEANLPPDVARRLRQGFAEAERGEFVDLTSEEMDRYIETGSLPERVERCLESYD
jgi:hypothetical protein